MGVNNIVIKPIIEQEEEKVTEQVGQKEKKKFSPGLTIRDVRSIERVIPGMLALSPEIILDSYVIRNGLRRSAKLVGVEPVYFDIYNFSLSEGQMFNEEQQRLGAPVCIIGHSIRTKFFANRKSYRKKYQSRSALVKNCWRVSRTSGVRIKYQ